MVGNIPMVTAIEVDRVIGRITDLPIRDADPLFGLIPVQADRRAEHPALVITIEFEMDVVSIPGFEGG